MITLREDWLAQAACEIAGSFPEFTSIGQFRVSCSWPSHGGRSSKRRVLGECWHGETTEDNIPQIFITPIYSKNEDVLPVLLHEMAHVIAGSEAKHGPKFAKIVHALGLEGKPTATRPTEELTKRLNTIVKELGSYPHSALKAPDKDKKQTTRMIKAECPTCQCVIRLSQKWIDEASGVLRCPMPDCDDEDMEIAE